MGCVGVQKKGDFFLLENEHFPYLWTQQMGKGGRKVTGDTDVVSPPNEILFIYICMYVCVYTHICII